MEAYQTLKRVMVAAAPAFGVSLVIWLVAVMFFASLMYCAESLDQQITFPEAIYWAIITMTTVGYGDIYTRTTAGRLFSAVCAFSGYVMLALPVAVLVTRMAQWGRENQRDGKETQLALRLRQGDQTTQPRCGSMETAVPPRL